MEMCVVFQHNMLGCSSIVLVCRYFSLSDGSVVTVFSGHSDYVLGGAITPDGVYALTGSLDTTVKQWLLLDGTVVMEYTSSSVVFSVDVSHDGTLSVVGYGSPGNEVHVIGLWVCGLSCCCAEQLVECQFEGVMGVWIVLFGIVVLFMMVLTAFVVVCTSLGMCQLAFLQQCGVIGPDNSSEGADVCDGEACLHLVTHHVLISTQGWNWCAKSQHSVLGASNVVLYCRYGHT